MDTLALAKQRMLWKEEWRDKANDGTDQELHDYHVEMEDLCRSDAVAYAAVAQAEQLQRIADSLAGIHDSLYRKGEEVVGVVDILEIINDNICRQ